MRAGRAELKLDLDIPCQMCQEPTATQIFLMFFKQALSTQPKWSLFQIMMEGYCSEFFQTWGKTAPERWPCSELIFSSFSYYPSKILDFKTRLLQLPAVAVWLMFKKKKKEDKELFLGCSWGWSWIWEEGEAAGREPLGSPYMDTPWDLLPSKGTQNGLISFLCTFCSLEVARKFFLTFNNQDLSP